MNNKVLVLVIFMQYLSGCAVYEALGGLPREYAELSISASIPTKHVFRCVKETIKQLKTVDRWWDTKASRENLSSGILEMGDFKRRNTAGFRLRAKHDIKRGALVFDLKGSGPYYMDLGVTKALETLTTGVNKCISI